MVDILSLVLHHDEQAVLCAVELALEAGVPTKTHILNLLHRLIDGKDGNPPRIDAPQALALNREPKANVARYDALRGKEVRSEEHTSELQSLMRISYAVFCLKKKNISMTSYNTTQHCTTNTNQAPQHQYYDA